MIVRQRVARVHLRQLTVVFELPRYAAFRLRARSDRVDRSDTIATIDTIAAETQPYPSRDRSDRSDRIATIAGA